MSGRLAGRRALVTGAARGIGAAIASAMAREGAHVVLGDRDEDEAKRIADSLRHAGWSASGREHDVTDEASWSAAIAAIEGIDILVNNAGILLIRPIAETSLEDFRHVAAVNTDGVFLGIKHAFAAMGARGGAIVNLSSIAGIDGAANHIAYCASKGAVRLMTKAAAIEAATLGYPIRVNSIHPGAIDTDMTQAGYRFGKGVGTEERIMAEVPLARIGRPDDVADAAVFLASDEAGYINGTQLIVDGGYTTGKFRRRPS